jgi:hypothetical protein
MKKQNSKKLLLNKQTVSVLKTKEMIMLKGGISIDQQQSDSFVACGSCFTDCRTNSRACDGDAF